jgi:hypothetical protein
MLMSKDFAMKTVDKGVTLHCHTILNNIKFLRVVPTCPQCHKSLEGISLNQHVGTSDCKFDPSASEYSDKAYVRWVEVWDVRIEC